MRLSLSCLPFIWLVSVAPTAGGSDAGTDFFESKIRPLLVKHCYECHSAEAKKLGGKLLLDSRDGVRKGGESGKVLEPGKPEMSPLISAVRYNDESLQMPPTGKLSAAEIADLESWVKMGAPDPRDKPTVSKSAGTWEEILTSRRDWWSLKPVKRPAIPPVRNPAWPHTPVDHFVLARLEAEGIAPSEPADPRTLARRLALVLTGLPPTFEQVEAFLNDYSSTPEPAIARLVDSLLDSPHFGERWARHWMDVVRFSETHGNEWNYEVHHAWRYRDYLIRAFNADLPYHQLVREHIAGDLLPQPRWNKAERFNESLIGTAFYRFGEVNHDDCISLAQLGYDIVDNQLDTLTKAFQATTVACARCHDHKLDAISQHDYYALLGILRSSRLVSHTLDAPEVNEPELRRLRDLKPEIRKSLANIWRRELAQIPAYMRAAQANKAQRADAAELAKGLEPKRLESWLAALKAEKVPLEDPLEPWRVVAASMAANEEAFAAEWQALAENYRGEDKTRTEFNKRFEILSDFRSGKPDGWQSGGHSLRGVPGKAGDFALATSGESLLTGIFPAGYFTHSLSDRLNGTLRSPLLSTSKKHISFQVLGQRSSALRLVSNNCQLNYKNYKALISNDLQWITLTLPDDAAGLRVYAELMTMFDNPKFPDQLSALGGDSANYRLPWEKAAENPRSYFGITRVVLHDASEPPKPEVGHMLPLFAQTEPPTFEDVPDRYVALLKAALDAWASNKATDADSRWLDYFLRKGLLANSQGASTEIDRLIAEYRRVEAELALPRIAPGVADFGPGFEQPVFVRGDCMRPGEAAPRRYLEVLTNSRAALATSGSGRLELAERIASPENPLTVRVYVNRIWHHLFGSGLVRTVDDFGHVGETPSHPELLDYLAAQFLEDGWSTKRLIRLLVLSRTFQLSSAPTAAAREIDPEYRLLSYYPARRLEGEAIRDAILTVSGRLDRTLYGPSIQPFREKENADRRLFPGPLDGGGRRSVYIKNNLMESPKFLGVFNLPGGKVTQGRRDVTNVPAQALALLNDPFVIDQSKVWAERLIARGEEPIAARIDAMFASALGRPPRENEQARFRAAVSELAQLHGVSEAEIPRSQIVWQDVAHAMINMREFIYIP
jgi:hypothetical protein